MKVVVNPDYENLRDFIKSILSRNYKADSVYRQFRNIVEDVTVDGQRLVVKIFKKPTEFNRVVYSFLRPTKARRSYVYSQRLLAAGIDVPVPVGYVEKKKGLFFHTGCFVSVYTDYRSIADFRNNPVGRKELDLFMDEFAAFTADFHSKGFVHGDFNIDNILYKKEGTHYHFQLIDLNRMTFSNRSNRKCAKDLSSVHFNQEMMSYILEKYCNARHIGLEHFSKGVLLNRHKAKGVSRFKDIVLTPLGLRKYKRSD